MFSAMPLRELTAIFQAHRFTLRVHFLEHARSPSAIFQASLNSSLAAKLVAPRFESCLRLLLVLQNAQMATSPRAHPLYGSEAISKFSCKCCYCFVGSAPCARSGH